MIGRQIRTMRDVTLPKVLIEYGIQCCCSHSHDMIQTIPKYFQCIVESGQGDGARPFFCFDQRNPFSGGDRATDQFLSAVQTVVSMHNRCTATLYYGLRPP